MNRERGERAARRNSRHGRHGHGEGTARLVVGRFCQVAVEAREAPLGAAHGARWLGLGLELGLEFGLGLGLGLDARGPVGVRLLAGSTGCLLSLSRPVLPLLSWTEAAVPVAIGSSPVQAGRALLS